MDLILEQESKLASLNNNNSSSTLITNNNNILNNNNNPLIKGVSGVKAEGTATTIANSSPTSSSENNNHLTVISNSPTAISPSPSNGEAVYEFGRDFGENPSHVISEKVECNFVVYKFISLSLSNFIFPSK